MKSLRDIEYVGWGTWALISVVLAPVGAFLLWHYTYENVNTAARLAMGAFLGMVAAAFVTTALNELLHRRNKRREQAQRKVERKQKRKK